MDTKARIKRQRNSGPYRKVESFGSPAGLARTHKLIRAERDLEIQFNKVSSQIKLNEYRHTRSENQREERLSKRHVG